MAVLGLDALNWENFPSGGYFPVPTTKFSEVIGKTQQEITGQYFGLYIFHIIQLHLSANTSVGFEHI